MPQAKAFFFKIIIIIIIISVSTYIPKRVFSHLAGMCSDYE